MDKEKHSMKLFLDTANLADIEEALKGGFIRGVTTNPSLLAREPKTEYLAHMKRIVDLLKHDGNGYPLSIEVFTDNQNIMIAQAEEFCEALNYENIAIKIHISRGSQNNMAVVRELSERRIQVNCTACMTPLQAMMAAASGAKYVSLFYNRIRDGADDQKFIIERERLLREKIIEEDDFSPDAVISKTRDLIEEYPRAEIIAGSIRAPLDITRAGRAGAHIITASLKILKSALWHFKTDEAVGQFFRDFEAWKQ